MPTQYDSSILQRFADEHYRQAKWITVGTALRYFLVALLLWIACGMVVGLTHIAIPDPAGVVVTVILFVVAIAAGIDAGRKKAFELKLKAQQILCQVAIEQNTRNEEKSLAATQN